MKHVLGNGTSEFQLLLSPAILGTWHLVTAELDLKHRLDNQMGENGSGWEPLKLMKTEIMGYPGPGSLADCS